MSGGRISDPVLLHKLFTNTFGLARRPFTVWVLVSCKPFHFPFGPRGELPPSHLHGNLQATEISTCSTERFFSRMQSLLLALCVPRGCSGLLPGALTTKCMIRCCQEGGLHSFPLRTSSAVAGRAGVKRCPLFCLCWLESLASHLAQAVLSPSQPSLGKALQYPGILTILNRLGATYGAK